MDTFSEKYYVLNYTEYWYDSDHVDIKYIYWILKIRKVISPPYIISSDIFNSYLQNTF